MIRQDTGNYNVFEVYSGNSSTVTASIQGGGSADFAGNVEVGNFAGNSGSYYFSNGAIYNSLSGGTADGEARRLYWNGAVTQADQFDGSILIGGTVPTAQTSS